MENYFIEETASEPKVVLDAQSHTLLFEGESRPEDVTNFYTPITDWLGNYEAYLKSDGLISPQIECTFKLDYFNSASSKSLLDIIEYLAEIQEGIAGCTVVIHWYYDRMDEDMKEAGEEFQIISQLTFKFHEI